MRKTGTHYIEMYSKCALRKMTTHLLHFIEYQRFLFF